MYFVNFELLKNKLQKHRIMLPFKDNNKIAELDVLSDYTKLSSQLYRAFDLFVDGNILRSFNNVKKRGYKFKELLPILILLPFVNCSNVCSLFHSGYHHLVEFQRDTLYALKNNPQINWRKLLYLFVKRFNLLSERKGDGVVSNNQCLIVDDTVLSKTGKSIEEARWVHDHTTGGYTWGFKMLCLGYWDGKSFLGIDFTFQKEIVSTQKKRNGFRKFREKETFGYKRKHEMNYSKIDNALSMIKRAVKQGIRARYVLADSWFVSDRFVKEIRSIKSGMLHVVGMCKKDNRRYVIDGKLLTAKALIAKYKCKARTCRKLKMKYFIVDADYKGIPIRLFFTKQGYSAEGDWKVILSTDLKLSFLRAMEIYHIRWSIEVYFREAKQSLNLGKCQSKDLDAQIAEVTLTMIQHLFLTLFHRFENYETKGELFRCCREEMVKANLAMRLWNFLIEMLQQLVELLEIDCNDLMEKVFSNPKSERKLIVMLQALQKDQKAA